MLGCKLLLFGKKHEKTCIYNINVLYLPAECVYITTTFRKILN